MYCVPVIENETGSRAFQELFYNLNYKTIVSQNLRMLERNLVFVFFFVLLYCFIVFHVSDFENHAYSLEFSMDMYLFSLDY